MLWISIAGSAVVLAALVAGLIWLNRRYKTLSEADRAQAKTDLQNW